MSTTIDTADEFCSFTVKNVRWYVRREWRETLVGPDGMNLSTWQREGRVQVIKDGAHRTVYRIDLPQGAVFVKHYRCPTWWDPLRNRWRASASRREFNKALELQHRGIATIRPLAFGEQIVLGGVQENYLITAASLQSVALNEFVEQLLNRPHSEAEFIRLRLAEALAHLCSELHRSGVYHDDLHAGNILVRCDSCRTGQRSERPELMVLDLPGIQFSAALDWPRSRDSLVMLHSDWAQRATTRERWHFWRHYVRARPELRLEQPRPAAAEIVERTGDYACQLMAGRAKRSLRSNRDFQFLRCENIRVHAVRHMSEADLRDLAADPQRLIREFVESPVKISHSGVVVEAELPINGIVTKIAYKRIQPRTLWKRLTRYGRPSRALHNWVMGHTLLERGIATAEPLCVFLPQGFQRGGNEYLATRWIEGGENLHLFAWRLARMSPGERWPLVRQAAESLGRLIGRMHAWRIAHRDLKGCNLMLVERPLQVDAYVLDLDGVRIRRQLSHAEQVNNLARLAVSAQMHDWLSRTDRLRFLRAYAQELHASHAQRKRWAREVVIAAKPIVSRIERQGHALA